MGTDAGNIGGKQKAVSSISKITTIQTLSLHENKRILAISDIHGEDTYLDGALKKANYTCDDILVVVGDIIEKGRESLRTVRYIMALQEENPNVYVTMGNVDFDRLRSFYDDSKEGREEFLDCLRWTKDIWERGFFLDCLEEQGIAPEEVSLENISVVKQQIEESYRKELDFLWNQPTILCIGDYIFVHGGIPTDSLEALERTDSFQYLKVDAFGETDVKFQKNVVVGHWPTCLYRDDIHCMNPLFQYEKHIIAIDGGCALKRWGGQLNVLIIPHAEAKMQDVTYVPYDDYPTVIAKKNQSAEKSTIGIRFTDCLVQELEEKEGLSKLRLISNGMEFTAPTVLLYRRGKYIYCDDYNDAHLEVKIGDRLSVLADTSVGKLVKKEGYIGWYKDR